MYREAKVILSKYDEDCVNFQTTIQNIILNHLHHLHKHNDYTSANVRNYSTLPPQHRVSHRALRTSYTDVWTAFLHHAQQRGEIRDDVSVTPLQHFILGAMNWTVEWYDTTRHPVDPLAVGMSRLFLKGMCRADPGAAISAPDVQSATQEWLGWDGKAERTRNQILRAAARVFREHGYRMATMRRIASEAKLEAGSVYYHFASKDAVVEEVLDQGLRDLLDGTRRAVEACGHQDQRARLATAIAAHLTYLFRKNEFASANIRIYGLLPEHLRVRHRPLRREYANFWDTLLRDAQAAGVLRPDIKILPLRQAILGGLNWTIEWFDPDPRECPDRHSLTSFAELVIRMLFNGIGSVRNDADDVR